MSINSRAKGSSYELKIAKKLTAWSGYEFNRTPMSGGLRWQEDNNISGDIVPPSELKFPFSIECKKREIDWDFSFIMKGTSPVWDFYKQSCRDSSRYVKKGILKEPMVIFAKNRRESHVVIRKEVFERLFNGVDIPHIYVHLYKKCDVVIIFFDDFLNNCTLEKVLSLNIV